MTHVSVLPYAFIMYCIYLLVRSKFALQILLSDANLEPIMPDSRNECLSSRHTSAFQRYILGRGVSGDFSTRPLHIEYCVQLHSNLLPNPTRTAPASQVTQQHRNVTSFPWFSHSFIRTVQRPLGSSANTSSYNSFRTAKKPTEWQGSLIKNSFPFLQYKL